MYGNAFFLGNALFDMSILCNHSLLQHYNLKPDENSEAADGRESLFELLLNSPSTVLSPGGSAQNSARVAQWVFNSHGKGGQATFVGCIGNDVYGKKLIKFLNDLNVKPLYYCHPSAPTGITAALSTNDGKRSLCARLGAAELFNEDILFTPEFLHPVLSAAMQAEYVYVEGYFVSHSPLCFLNFAKIVKNSSKHLAVNLSAIYICETHFKNLDSCVALADIVIGNKEEAEAYVQKCGLPNESIETCAKTIALLPGHHKPRVVIITQGPDPVVVVDTDDMRVQYCDVPSVHELGDTIGCGDAFVGGFLAMLSLGITLQDAVKYGVYCATCIAQERGCTIPTYSAELKA